MSDLHTEFQMSLMESVQGELPIKKRKKITLSERVAKCLEDVGTKSENIDLLVPDINQLQGRLTFRKIILRAFDILDGKGTFSEITSVISTLYPEWLKDKPGWKNTVMGVLSPYFEKASVNEKGRTVWCKKLKDGKRLRKDGEEGSEDDSNEDDPLDDEDTTTKRPRTESPSEVNEKEETAAALLDLEYLELIATASLSAPRATATPVPSARSSRGSSPDSGADERFLDDDDDAEEVTQTQSRTNRKVNTTGRIQNIAKLIEESLAEIGEATAPSIAEWIVNRSPEAYNAPKQRELLRVGIYEALRAYNSTKFIKAGKVSPEPKAAFVWKLLRA